MVAISCKEMKTEGDHTWMHHDTILTHSVDTGKEERTSTYICFPNTLEECGATMKRVLFCNYVLYLLLQRAFQRAKQNL